MTNGERSNAYSIGSAVANALHSDLQTIQATLAMIQTSLAALYDQQRTMSGHLEGVNAGIQSLKNAEREKASAVLTFAERTKSEIEMMRDEAEDTFREEEYGIQDDYDRTQLELIKNFAESVKTDTETIDKIKTEYKEIYDLENAMLDDLDHLRMAHIFNYSIRKARLQSKRNGISANLDSFLGSRIDTAKLIDSLQTPIPVSEVGEPCTVYVPFWVVGIGDDTGEEIHVFGVQERMRPAAEPTAYEPYVDHLVPHATSNEGIWYYSDHFFEEEEIERAKEQSVEPDMDQIVQRMPQVLRDCIDISDPQGSRFLAAFKRFAFRVTKKPEPVEQKELIKVEVPR